MNCRAEIHFVRTGRCTCSFRCGGGGCMSTISSSCDAAYSKQNSATGTRTRVARVRAEYPNQLDYSGCGKQRFQKNMHLSSVAAKMNRGTMAGLGLKLWAVFLGFAAEVAKSRQCWMPSLDFAGWVHPGPGQRPPMQRRQRKAAAGLRRAKFPNATSAQWIPVVSATQPV